MMRTVSREWAGNVALGMAVVGACAGASPVQAQGKQTYTDPNGVYSVLVPNGWEAQPQQGSPLVSIVNAKTKVSESLGVMRGPEDNTPSSEKQLQTMEAQFPQSCPQAKILERGQQRLAGMSGAFVSVTCNGQDGPQTMKFIAATRPGIVAMDIVASPGNAYLRELIPLHEIENSLKVLGGGGGAAGGGQGGQGAMPAMGGNPGTMSGMGGALAQGGGMGTYHDPQGRFSLAVPDGWNTASDNGNLTLSSGASWVSVATGTGSSPGDVSHNIVQQIQSQYQQFQMLNEGDFQNNGHAAHGTNATGVNPKGQRVSLLVVSISAGSGNYLILISSSPNDQAKQINATVMQVAQSVSF